MSESTSGPYKSKLFNFLNRQTIKVKEQVERTVRQAKVAATWGLQVVMYPIYLIFQSTRYASYRFQQAAQESWKRLQPATETEQPPPVDTPIQQVLQLIEELPYTPVLAGVPQPSAGELTPLVPSQALETIGGKLGHKGIIAVASSLETQKLVLVAPNYQILDILTPEQQTRLMRRIVWEIASYKHNCRLWALSAQKFNSRILPRRKTQVLRPIRWLWQTMAWLQTSEVAVAIDLFQESQLVAAQFAEISPPVVLPPQISQLLPELEIPGMAVVEQQLDSLDLAIAKAETYLLSRSPLAPPALRSENQKIDREHQDPFSWQKLVLAAIDYFFGASSQKKKRLHSKESTYPQGLPQTSNLSLPSSPTLDDIDPWLSWEELFPKPPIEDSPFPQAKSSALPPAKVNPPKIPGKKTLKPKLPSPVDPPRPSRWSTLKTWLGINDTEKIPKDLATAASRAIQADDNSENLPHKSQNLGEAIATTSNSPSLEYQPHWIETEATSKGYVKPPLEKLLEWLDRIVLSLEKLCGSIYQQLKRWFKL